MVVPDALSRCHPYPHGVIDSSPAEEDLNFPFIEDVHAVGVTLPNGQKLSSVIHSDSSDNDIIVNNMCMIPSSVLRSDIVCSDAYDADTEDGDIAVKGVPQRKKRIMAVHKRKSPNSHTATYTPPTKASCLPDCTPGVSDKVSFQGPVNDPISPHSTEELSTLDHVDHLFAPAEDSCLDILVTESLNRIEADITQAILDSVVDTVAQDTTVSPADDAYFVLTDVDSTGATTLVSTDIDSDIKVNPYIQDTDIDSSTFTENDGMVSLMDSPVPPDDTLSDILLPEPYQRIGMNMYSTS
ncbi:uncharacterized protein LOC117320377, partial [Pecten maximus]|uniref:uncharacterized protein LOC117320377 n=1 Tax=Pecten maximus TaxID=6579 RepID=UPI001458DCE2